MLKYLWLATVLRLDAVRELQRRSGTLGRVDHVQEIDQRCLLFRCLIPQFDGVILWLEWQAALWDTFVMGAPRPRTPSEQRYSDRAAEPGAGDQSQDARQMAQAQNGWGSEDRSERTTLNRSRRRRGRRWWLCCVGLLCWGWRTVFMRYSRRSRP